jgi:hypothetical protein
MNTALQCLLSTTELSHFFLRGFYKKEINFDNPLGLKGKLAESFKRLVDQTHSHTATWAHSRNVFGDLIHSVEPSQFKFVISSLNGGVFAGYMQQDSQELLCAVLDGIHEDLNRVKQKPYVENVVGDGADDRSVAEEAWRRYKLRNDSFVVDTFQGQLRSRVTCSECKNMSVSFDPSMYMSVAFKKLVVPASLRVVVKFESPTMARPADQINLEELPHGFHFDCDVKVLIQATDTFASLVKHFEDRSPCHRFVVLTLNIPYSGMSMYDGFAQPSETLPVHKTYGNYVVLEVPSHVADWWLEADRIATASVLNPRDARSTARFQGDQYDRTEECSSDSDDYDYHDAAPYPSQHFNIDALAPEQKSGLYAIVGPPAEFVLVI